MAFKRVIIRCVGPLSWLLDDMNSISLAVLIFAMSSCATADSGSVCISKIPTATSGSKSLSNPNASSMQYDFEISIANQRPVKTSHLKSVLIDNLSTAQKHKVSISRGGKPFSAFSFTFADHKTNHVCLWFGPLYESWSIWPMSQSKGKCACSRS